MIGVVESVRTRTGSVVAFTVVVAALVVAAAIPAHAAAPLAHRSDTVDVRLDNGLRVIILPRQTADRRVVLRLVVRAGTLHDPDGARGVAHLTQHLVFDGSPRFPHGSARKVFQSLGMDLDTHRTAYVAFDHTSITLTLPSPAEGVFIKSLAFFADTLVGPTFADDAIETERRVITDEQRRQDSAGRRVFDQVIVGLAPGSRLSRRLPSPAPDALSGVTRRDLQAFHQAWYAPSNAVLIVVGDLEPDDALGLIRSELGAVAPRPTPPAPEPGVRATAGLRAIIATDSGLSQTVVALIRVADPMPPALDEESFRAGLIDQMVRRLLQRRLEARAFANDAAFTSGSAYLGEAFGAMFVAQIAVIGAPATAHDSLADLLIERTRALRYGFTAGEMDLARRSILADAQAVTDAEPSMDAVELADLLTEQTLAGAVLVSPADNLSLVRRLLPTVTRDAAARRCAEVFATDACVVVVEGPPGDGTPTAAAVIELARRSDATPVGAPAAPVLLGSIADPVSPPIAPVSVEVDPSLGVTTARLANGVVVHHKRLEGAGRVTLRVTFAGGEIDETGATRGLTRAAAAGFERPAGVGRDGLAVRDALRVRGARVRARVELDTVSVEITVPPDDAHTAFEVARLLTHHPVLEPAAFAQWRTRALAVAAQRRDSASAVLDDAVARTLSAEDDPRLLALTGMQIGALTLDAARTWLARLVTSAPIEMAIVGPIDRVSAVTLAAEYLSDGAPHPPPGASHRRAPPSLADPPLTRVERFASATGSAAVAVGFRGPDATQRDEVAALDLAERAILPALSRRLRDREGLAGSVRIEHAPAQVFEGFGVFLVIATTGADSAERVADIIEEELRAFATGGPGASEVALAQSQIATTIRGDADDPNVWSRRLARWELRGTPLETPAARASALAVITPDAVRRAVADRLTQAGRIRVLILPAER